MDKQKIVFDKLDALGIDYTVMQHPAAFTIEDIDALNISQYGCVCKNLFLRDAAGRRHFLVALRGDKQADLGALRAQLGCSRLSFGSEARLMRHLGLTKGSVSLLGVVNDAASTVEVVLDRDLMSEPIIGVHPNINTATVWLTFDALVRFIRACGNRVEFVEV